MNRMVRKSPIRSTSPIQHIVVSKLKTKGWSAVLRPKIFSISIRFSCYVQCRANIMPNFVILKRKTSGACGFPPGGTSLLHSSAVIEPCHRAFPASLASSQGLNRGSLLFLSVVRLSTAVRGLIVPLVGHLVSRRLFF